MRPSLISLGFTALCVGVASVSEDPAPVRDVVVIIFDTTRADRISSYGWKRETTPRMDRLAREGVRFAAHHSTSSWTKPGMASLITGRYPREVGVYEERFDRLPDAAETLAEQLRKEGYTTLGVSSNPNVSAAFGYEQGFDVHSDSDVVWGWVPRTEGQKAFHRHEAPLPTAQQVTETALELVDEHRTGAPLYLQVLYIDPHTPYNPVDSARAQMGPKATDYELELRFADEWAGRLLDGLEQRGIGEDALVIFTSDHGEGLNSHPGVPQANTHGYTLYDSVTHVPMVIRDPGLPSGRVVDALSSHVDVVATVRDLLGLRPTRTSGDSLRGRIAGDPGPEVVFSETDWRVCSKTSARSATHRFSLNPDHERFRTGVYEAGATERDKAFLAALPPVEAYRMDGKHEHPKRTGDEQASLLRPTLEAWIRDTPALDPVGRTAKDALIMADGRRVPDPHAGGETEELDEATLESLRALGYLR